MQLTHKIFSYLIIIGLCFLIPNAINIPAQSSIQAIATGLAVDKSPTGIEASIQVIIPKVGNYTQTIQVVHAEGIDLNSALNNLEFLIGQEISLAHCYVIVLGNEICQDNITEVLDTLIRGNSMGNNTVLIHSATTGKELLEASSQANTSDINSLQNIIKFNNNYLFTENASLRSFYADYLSPHQTSTISSAKNSPQSANSGTSQNMGSSDMESGGSSSSTQSTQSLPIENKGDVAIFVAGKLVTILNAEEKDYFNWLDKKVQVESIKLYNISDEKLNNATISYTNLNKSIDCIAKIVNNVPIIDYTINIQVRAESIKQQNSPSVNFNYLSETVKTALQDKISNEVQQALNISKEYKFDAYNYYHLFNITNTQAWKKYLSTLNPNEWYLDNLIIKTTVNVTGML